MPEKITELPFVASLNGTELVEVVQSTISKKATLAEVIALADTVISAQDAVPLEVVSDGTTTINFPDTFFTGTIRHYRNGDRMLSTSFTENVGLDGVELTYTPDNADVLIFDYKKNV